jgi:hypothetical protein
MNRETTVEVCTACLVEMQTKVTEACIIKQEYETCYKLVQDTMPHVKIKFAPDSHESFRE